MLGSREYCIEICVAVGKRMVTRHIVRFVINIECLSLSLSKKGALDIIFFFKEEKTCNLLFQENQIYI